ncbi:hypothetical protein HG530_003186 [Fusarium avenaceum]|nr:hypothetical protein HG530_003186 [Fusarium avenaceum]
MLSQQFFIVVQKFLGSDHVEKLKHSAAFDFIGGLRSKTTDGGDAHVEVCYLCVTDTGFADLDLLATNIHAVKSVKRCWIGNNAYSGLFCSSILDQDKSLGLTKACEQLDNLLFCQEGWDVGNAQLIDGIRNNVRDDLGVVGNFLGDCGHHIVARSANFKAAVSSLRAIRSVAGFHGNSIQRQCHRRFWGILELDNCERSIVRELAQNAGVCGLGLALASWGADWRCDVLDAPGIYPHGGLCLRLHLRLRGGGHRTGLVLACWVAHRRRVERLGGMIPDRGPIHVRRHVQHLSQHHVRHHVRHRAQHHVHHVRHDHHDHHHVRRPVFHRGPSIYPRAHDHGDFGLKSKHRRRLHLVDGFGGQANEIVCGRGRGVGLDDLPCHLWAKRC